MKKYIRKTLPENVQAIVTYQINCCLQSLKDIYRFYREFYCQSNLVYYGRCPNQTCTEDYLGETDRRIKERIIDHGKRDNN